MREQHGPITEEQSLPRFGNYDLVRRIDVGGMGEVYLARQRSAFGRSVAIKIIRSDLVHDMTARARFLREAEVSAHLKHEHILPLFEFGEDQGRLFLVTPYIEGGTLARRLQSGPLSLSEAHQLFVPLVQAIVYIHRRGVIHRDLKPTNILLDEEDEQIYVRLIDFGIASIQGDTAGPSLTTGGSEVGTIAYMAPERLSGVIAPSNDIFSLGVILYQMLTGHLPLGQQPLNLPQSLEYVVQHCIAIRPEDRFATAEEVLKNFEHAYQLLVTSSRVPAAPVPPVPPSSSHLSGALDGSSNAPVADSAPVRELVALQNSGTIAVVAAPQPQSTFGREDYNAPTTWFDTVNPQGQQPGGKKTGRTPSPGKQRSLLPLLSAVTVIVLLAIIAMGYYGYQAVATAAVTINFSPQTQAISEMYTLNANPSVQAVNVDMKSIPARGLSSNKQTSLTGPTTGRVNCSFGIFGCQQGVRQEDVNALVAQMQPTLEQQIKQDLLSRLASVKGTQVGSINFQDPTATSNPSVGSVGKTVTVTLAEQGSVGYILNGDAQNVAQQLLTQQAQQLGSNYMLLSSSITFGVPVVEVIDGYSGQVTINIAAGGIAEYQFQASQLQAIQNALKGRKVNDARNYLVRQQGIDPKTVGVHFTRGGGDTLPGDPQQIMIVPLNPANLPQIQLQSVPTSTFTPSTDSGSDNPTLTPTQTGDNNQ